jgi:exodeoxyribonuclease VII large subunit
MSGDSSFFQPPHLRKTPYTVSEINATIATVLETGTPVLWVEAEVSNFKRAASGHCYFTLRDDQSQIPAVLWRSNAAKVQVKIEDGMKAGVIAALRVYRKGGYYQLDVLRVQHAGRGALFAAFEALKEKLAGEGLFDPQRKKPLPETVRRLGVITSKRGAAVRDIIKVTASRAPQTDIVLIDVAVQGEGAAAAIAAAIADMNAYGNVDCLIVGRGGGSLEDLWAFNEEAVARAIAASKIPVISAVGHEIDVTIADFAADMRAPTPSAAAEMAVADTQELARLFAGVAGRFRSGFSNFFRTARSSLRQLTVRAGIRMPPRLVTELRQSCDDCRERIMRGMEIMLRGHRHTLSTAVSRLTALSPLNVLARGYSVVTSAGGGTVVDSGQLKEHEKVGIRFHKGRADASIVSIERPPLRA